MSTIEILDLKMAENEKTYEQQQREYLWEILKAGLTIISDEDEGHGQVVNYPNVCIIDNLDDMEKPPLTPQELRNLLHLNDGVKDGNANELGNGDGGDGDMGFRDFVEPDSKNNSLIDDGKDSGYPNNIDGTDNSGIKGDVTDGNGD